MANFPKLTDVKKLQAWSGNLVRELDRQVRYTAHGSFTLQSGATTTTVRNSAIRLGSTVVISPETATAATEIASTFVPRISITDGAFTVTHLSNTIAARTFAFVVFEPSAQIR